jgi:hypothetical protein
MLHVRSRDIFPIIYSVSVASIHTVLVLLGEGRIDVYVSLYILAYYILRALITPLPRRIDSRLRYIDFTLFFIFSLIVAYRVILILAPDLIGVWLA